MMQQLPEKRIKQEEIEKHPWYQGPLPTSDELRNDMRERAEPMININKAEIQSKHQIKMQKLKNLVIQEPKLNLQRTNSKVEQLRNKWQDAITDINIYLQKEKEQRMVMKQQNKVKKMSEDIGSLNISPHHKISEIKDGTPVKNVQGIEIISPENFAKTVVTPMKNLVITKTEVMEPSAQEFRRKLENDNDIANIAENLKRKNEKIKFFRREEDKHSSGSDSDE